MSSSGMGMEDVIRRSIRGAAAQMTKLAERMAAEDFQSIGIENGKVSNWKDEIDAAAVKLGTSEGKRKVIDAQILRVRNKNVEDLGADATKVMEKELHDAIKNEMKSFDAKKQSLEYQGVQKLLKRIKTDEAKEDGDIELLNKGYTETDFICPVTRLKMDRPQRNTVCGHRVSHAALKMLCKKGGGKCPIPGCHGIWNASNHVDDNDHDYQMSKFYREKSASDSQRPEGVAASSTGTATTQAAFTQL